jgi:UDP-glucose 4-epimerase
MTSFLVTGGAGFIGSHLVEALLARGEQVTVYDDVSTGSTANIAGVMDHPAFSFVRGSIRDAYAVDELVRDHEVVVHLAAAVGVRLVMDQPLRSLATNVQGCEHVVHSAARYGRKLLYASTSEVYGKNVAVPLAETDDGIIGPPTITRWSYALAKAVGEHLVLESVRGQRLRGAVVRLFNTVGPRQSPAYGMVIPRFVRQATEGRPITVYGDGQQRRCFCHVLDTVDALLRLIDDPGAVGEVFNVGTQEEVSVLELAHRVSARAGVEPRIEFIPYSEAFGDGFEDMLRRVPDTRKLRRLTGWEPRRDLDMILDQTMAAVPAAIA